MVAFLLSVIACTSSDDAGSGARETGADSLVSSHSGETADTGAPGPLAERTVALWSGASANLLLPIKLGMDVGRRRLYVSSNGMPVLAEVDLDRNVLVDVTELPDMPDLHPDIAPHAGGGLWLGFKTSPALAYYDPATASLSSMDTDIAKVHALVATSDGDVVAAAQAEDGDRLLALGSGTVDAELDLVAALALDPDASGAVNVLASFTSPSRPDAVVTVDARSLEEQSRCELVEEPDATSGFSWMDELSSVGFAVSQERSIAVIDCAAGSWESVRVGTENRSVFSVNGDAFAVLDRMGGRDSNWGLMRTFDRGLATVGRDVQVGNNGGYAAFDPVTRQVWVNAEGTAEVWAVDLDTARVAQRVRLGAHVESIVADPDDDDRIFFTGRLASSYGWIDLRTGGLASVSDALAWPISPTWLDGRLYVLDSLNDAVSEIDPVTLEVIRTFSAGLGSNATLTHSDLAADPVAHRLYVANGGRDAISAIDAENGSVMGVWELGEPIEDGDVPGRLEITVVDGAVVSVRNNDGAVRRLDPSTGTVVRADADGPAQHYIVVMQVLDALVVSDDGARVWYGPWAFDPVTLQTLYTLEQEAQVVRDFGSDGLVLWDRFTSAATWLGSDGSVRARRDTASAPWGSPALLARRGRAGDVGLVTGSFHTAEVAYVPFDAVR